MLGMKMLQHPAVDILMRRLGERGDHHGQHRGGGARYVVDPELLEVRDFESRPKNLWCCRFVRRDMNDGYTPRNGLGDHPGCAAPTPVGIAVPQCYQYVALLEHETTHGLVGGRRVSATPGQFHHRPRTADQIEVDLQIDAQLEVLGILLAHEGQADIETPARREGSLCDEGIRAIGERRDESHTRWGGIERHRMLSTHSVQGRLEFGKYRTDGGAQREKIHTCEIRRAVAGDTYGQFEPGTSHVVNGLRVLGSTARGRWRRAAPHTTAGLARPPAWSRNAAPPREYRHAGARSRCSRARRRRAPRRVSP